MIARFRLGWHAVNGGVTGRIVPKTKERGNRITALAETLRFNTEILRRIGINCDIQSEYVPGNLGNL
jgi:hypothetical protein